MFTIFTTGVTKPKTLRTITGTLSGILLGVFLLFTVFNHANAAAPTTLNFQARLLTGSGAIVQDGTYNVEFKIYNASGSTGSSQGSCTGDANCLWTETRTAGNKVTVKSGYLSVYLGDVTSLPSGIWDQQLWLTMNIGGTGAASWDGEMTPRLRLTSVPYAFQAANANTLNKTSGANTGTLSFGTVANNPVITLPDATGTVCLTTGNCAGVGGTGDILQNGNSFGTTMTIGTNDSNNLVLETVNTPRLTINTTGDILLGTSDTTGNLLVLDTKTSAGDPTGQNGGMYYNSNSNKFRCYQNSGWTDCIGTAGGSGVSAVGTIDSQSKSADGAVISGTTIYFQTADSTNPGFVSTGVQTFAGAKTFSGAITSNAGITFAGASTDITTGTNEDLTVVANGTGTIVLNDTVTVANTLTVSAGGITVTTGGLTVSAGGASITGNSSVATAAGNTLSIGNSTGALTVTGNSSSSFVLNGVTVDPTEFNRLDGKDAALVDTNDAVNTAITGTGALASGSIASGFGTISTGNTITTTATITGGNVNVSTGGQFQLNGTQVTSAILSNDSNLAKLNATQSFSATNTFTSNLDLSNTGVFSTNSGATFTTAGTSNNAALNTASLFKLDTSGAAQIINGITAGRDGQHLTLINTDAALSVTLTNNSGSATGSKIITGTGSDAVLSVGASIELVYDTTNSFWRVVGGVAGGNGTCSGCANTALSNIASTNLSAALNVTSGNLTLQTTTSGNIVLDGAGTINLNDAVTAAATITISGVATDITTGTNEDLTLVANGTGVIVLNDGTTAAGTVTFSGVATDITTATNEDLTVVANGTGIINLNDSVTVANGLTVSAGGASITGNSSIATTAGNTLSVGNSTGLITFVSAAGNVFTINGATVTDVEFNRLDGKDAALVDTNDAVNTAITGTGALSSGSIASGFGTISTANTITTTATVTGGNVNVSTGGQFQLNGTQVTSAILSNDSNLAKLNGTQTFSATNTFSSNLDISSTGILSTNSGATFTTAGTSNNATLNTASLFKLDTSGAAQIINGITAGRDGQRVTLINTDAALSVTLSNNSGSATGSKIITGTGADVTLAVGSSVELIYDTTNSFWRVVGGVAGGNGTCSSCANTALSNIASTNLSAALNVTSGNLTLQTTTSGNIVLDGAGTINLNDAVISTAGVTFSGVATDITTGTNEDLTVVANGTGTIVLNDTVTAAGTLTFSGVATDITTGTNEDLTVVANGTGIINLNDSVTVANGLTVSAGGASITGNATISTTAGNTFSVGNSTGQGTITGNASTTFVINGATVDATEFNRLDGKDAALVDTNDAVNTAITGTGALASGSIASGFGTISTGNNITTTATVQGGTVNATSTIQLNGTSINTAGTLTNVAYLNQTQTFSGTTNTFSGNLDLSSTGVLSTNSGATFTTAGTSNNAALNTASLFKLDTSGAAQIINGITAGRDGQRLTLINTDVALSVTLSNNSGSATGSKIITGTGSDVTLAVGAAIELVYDTTNSVWRVTGGVAGGNGTCSSCANTALSNIASTNLSAALNVTSGNLTLQTTTSGNIVLDGVGTINLNDAVISTAGVTFSGVATDITSGTNEDLTIVANGTGVIVLNDSITAGGTQTFSGVATDITTGTNEDLTVVANGTGIINLNDSVTIGNGLTVSAGGASVTGNTTISTAAANTFSIGNSTGQGTITGNASTTFVINGATVDATEFNRLDGKDAALVDTNDAVNTAITGTGALTSGSIASGFGTISTGNSITTTATVQGGTVNATSTIQLNGTSINTAGTLTNVAYLNQTQTFSGTTNTFSGNLDLSSTGIFSTNSGATFTTAGTSNNAALNTASLFKLDTSAAAQVINGITAGRDGQRVTLINTDAALSVTLTNNSGSATGSKIITGTGSDVSLPVGAAIELIYDTTNTVWRVTGGVAGGSGTCSTCANTALSNLASVNINTALNATSANLTLQTTTSGNIVLDGAGTINLNDAVISTAGVTFSGVATDITTGTNEDLTVVANGTGVIVLNDSITAGGTLTFSGVASDITTGTNEDLTVVANGTGIINLNDSVTIGNGLTVSAGGASITGNTTISTTAANTFSIGNSTGQGTITGNASTTFVINGATVDATEFNRLDGKDAALVDTNDAVNTAITGTGALASGSIASGFGTISTGNNITTTATVQGGTVNATSTIQLNGTSINTAGTLTNVAYLNQTQTFSGTTNTFSGNLDLSSTGVFSTNSGATFTTAGTSNNATLNTASLFKLDTSGAAQIINGITAGRDGQRLVLINTDAALSVTLSNNSGSATGSKIITGTAADVTLAVGASVELVYDTTNTVWRVTGGVAGGAGTCPTCANTALSNIASTNLSAALNTTSGNLTLQTTTSGNIVLDTAAGGTINLNDAVISTAGVTFSGVTTDITTGTNEDLTVVANGTGTIVLNDTITAAGTLTFSGVASDITTGANEDLTVVANGTGIINLNDSVTVGSGLTVSAGGANITGNSSIATTAGNTLSVGNSTGLISFTSAAGNVFNINGATVDSTEFNRLDGKDAALVDTNDAVNTAITGTGALASGSIASGFGTISTGNNITTTAVLQGGSATLTGASSLTVGTTGSATGSIIFKGSTAASGSITLIGQNNPGTQTITLPNETGTVCTTASGGACSALSFYIQNQSASPQTANYFIQSAADATTSAVFRARATQTADILQTQTSGGSIIAGIRPNGTIYSASITDPTTDVPATARLFVQANASGSNSIVARASSSGTGVSTDGAVILAQSKDGATNLFAVGASGIITLRGGQTTDVTTTSAGTSSAIGIRPGDSTTNSGTGSALTLQGSNQTGTTSTGGAVNITGGTGTSTNGAVNLQTSFNGATNINTGTSTGTVSVGNSAAGAITAQSGSGITLTTGSTSLLTIQGTAPSSVAGNGTNAGSVGFSTSIVGTTGGATSGTTGQVAGNGAAVSIVGGTGGAASSGSQNGAGGSVLIAGGTAGAGTGTGNFRGNVILQESGGNVAIGTLSPNNILSVKSLTTADALAVVAVSTSTTTNKGIVVQGVASQSANLFEAQSSTGGVLASISSTGLTQATLLRAQPAANGTALQVWTAGGLQTFGVDTSTGLTQLGSGGNVDGKLRFTNIASGAQTVTLQLGTTTAGYTLTLPTTVGAASDCLKNSGTAGILTFGSCSGSTTTLQSAYDADTDGSDATISLTSTDGSLIFTNPSAGGSTSAYVLSVTQQATGAVGGLDIQSAGTGNLFRVRDTTATASDVLTIADGGATTLRNQTNSTSGFQIQATSNNSVFRVDTSNERVAIGVTASVDAKLHVITGSTVTFRAFQSATNDILQLASNNNGGGGNADVLNVNYLGAITARNYTDSTSAFLLQNGTGTTNVLRVDTTNGRIGINLPSATAPTADVTFGVGNRTINIITQTTANTAGSNLTINSGQGNGTGAGGIITLQPAAGGTTGVGGAVTVQGGNGGSTSGAGGAASLLGGNASNGNSAGGAVTVQAGGANGTGTGGNVTIQAGAASATALSNAGAIAIVGAAGVNGGASGGTKGGDITVTGGTGGAGNSSSTGGNGSLVTITTGTGGAAIGGTGGNGGVFTLQGGTGGAGGSGDAGVGAVINILSGNGGGATAGFGGLGGTINITGGGGGNASSASGLAGNGATINLTAGNGGTAVAGSTGGSGGNISISAGSSGSGGTTGSPVAGTVTITAGASNYAQAGGLVTIQGGAAAAVAGSAGGGVSIAGRNGSSTTTGGVGGSVTITAGNAAGSGNNNSGTITLQAGSATGTGTAGGVIVKNAADSTTAFRVQNAAGSATYLSVDTSAGTTSITGGSGGGINAAYINTGATNNVGLYIQGVASQGDDLLNIRNSSNTKLFTVKSDGATFLGTDPGGTNTLAIRNASFSGTNIALLIRAHGSQSVDLLQIQDSSSNVNAAFNSSGNQLTLGRVAAAGTVTQGKLVLADGTTDNFGLTLQSSTITASRTYSFPDSPGNATDTVCLLTLANCSGSATTLQASYNADADTGDTIISLTAADDSLIFRNPSAGGTDSAYVLTIDQLATGSVGGLSVQSAGTGNLLLVTDTTATARDVLTIADGGVTTFRTQTDNTAGFTVKNAAATTTALQVDTSNSRVGIALAAAAVPSADLSFGVGSRTINILAQTTANTVGSSLTINAGQGNGTGGGGSLTVQAGSAGATSGAGGTLNLQGGNATTTGTGGAVNISAGTSAGSVLGGAVSITSGSTNVASSGGALNITSGSGGSGGTITIQGGSGTSGVSGVGGGIVLNAGDGTVIGGSISLTAGAGGSAVAGSVSLTGGVTTSAGVAGGSVSITGGAATGVAANGGSVTLQGGAAAAVAGSAGGAATIAGRNGSTTGTGGVGGAVTITAGNAGGSGNNNAGTITLQAGSATGTGATGGVIVKNAANYTTAFQIQNAASNAYFTADSTNAQILLGKTSSLAGKLQFANATNANIVTVTTAVQSTGSFTATIPSLGANDTFCFVTLNNCAGGGGGSTLQGAYTASTGGTTPEIKLDTTRNGLDIQDANTTIGSTTDLFAVRGPNASGLGAAYFNVQGSGNVGIGVTTPTSVLHLLGPNQATPETDAVTAITATGGTGGASSTTNQAGFGSGFSFTGGNGGNNSSTGFAGNGGSFSVTGGNGGVGSGNDSGAGGSTTIFAGDGGSGVSAGAGGIASLNSGNGGAGTIGGAGGQLTIQSGNGGNGTSTNGSGGGILLRAGSAGSGAGSAGAAGTVTVRGFGNSTTAFRVQTSSSVDVLLVDTSSSVPRLYVGPSAGNTTGTLLVLGKKTNSGDPAGVVGGMYYNSSLGEFRCFRSISTNDTGAWENCGINPIDRGFMVEDEFMGGSVSSNAIGALGWTLISAGLTASNTFNNGMTASGDHPGYIQFVTGTNNGDGDLIRLAGITSLAPVTINDTNIVKASVAASTGTNTTLRVGLSGQTTATQPVTGVWVELDSTSGSSNWRYCYGNGTTATCTASSVAFSASTWTSIEIRITGVGSGTSSAEYYIAGNKFTVSGVTIGNGGANATSPVFSCHNSTASTRSCYIDYIQFRGNASGVR